MGHDETMGCYNAPDLQTMEGLMMRRILIGFSLITLAFSTPTVQAAEAGGTSWKDVYNSGQKAIDDGEYDKAVEILAKAEAEASSAMGKAPSANGQGLALLRSRRYSEAVPHFERALKHDPNFLIAKKNLGFTLVQMYALGLSD